MTNSKKKVLAVVLLVAAGGMFIWYAMGGGQVERGLPSVSPPDRNVALKDVPQAVQDAIKKEVGPNGVIEDIKEDNHADGRITYEADIVRAGKKEEIKIAPDGSIIERE